MPNPKMNFINYTNLYLPLNKVPPAPVASPPLHPVQMLSFSFFHGPGHAELNADAGSPLIKAAPQ